MGAVGGRRLDTGPNAGSSRGRPMTPSSNCYVPLQSAIVVPHPLQVDLISCNPPQVCLLVLSWGEERWSMAA